MDEKGEYKRNMDHGGRRKGKRKKEKKRKKGEKGNFGQVN